MEKILSILAGLFLSITGHAGNGIISFSLDLNPVTSRGIFIDSTILILAGSDSASSQRVVIMGNNADHRFDSLEAGNYSLAVQCYQQDYVLTENFSKGYLSADEEREVTGNVMMACAFPMLYLNWNPDQEVNGDDFFDFAIDPDSNFLKRYPLPQLDSLARSFRDTGMHYYQEYPIHWGLLDTNLIPIIDYPWGFHRNPVTTCHTAFAFYDEYVRNGDSLSYLGFMNNVKWLMENKDTNYYLHYDFDFRHYNNFPSGWISGMAQGLALCAISLAYYETGEQKYLDGAAGIFGTLKSNTAGLFSIAVDAEDYYWIEEYPHRDFCHVFNGYMASLWGLWCYYTISGEAFAGELLESGMKTIVDHYPDWNYHNNDLSYYCLHHKLDQTYHEKHKMQLRTYGEYFSVPEMFKAANCFENRYFAAYPRALVFTSDSSLERLTVISSLNWNVETDADWLSYSRKGDTLEVTSPDNPSAHSRTARIYFSDADTDTLQTILVTQEGTTYLPIAKIDSIYVSADSGLLRFLIEQDSGWTVTSRSSWITARSENDSVFTVKYQANPYSEKRTGLVEVHHVDSLLLYHLRVFQDSLPLLLSARPDSVWVGHDSGLLEIRVETGHSWDIAFDSSWIRAQKVNDTLIEIRYLENSDYHQRMTSLICYLTDGLAVSEIKITQRSRPLYLMVDPAMVNLEADSSIVSIAVHAPVSWSANSLVDWLLPMPYNDSVMYVAYRTNVLYSLRHGTVIVSLNDTLNKEVQFYQKASTVGISYQMEEEEPEIYPNPASSKVHIRFASTGTGPLDIDVFNLSGEKVLNKKILSPGTETELDISRLGKGIYFIRLTGPHQSHVRKLVIE